MDTFYYGKIIQTDCHVKKVITCQNACIFNLILVRFNVHLYNKLQKLFISKYYLNVQEHIQYI